MTADERESFERDGFLVIPNALSEDETAFAKQAILDARERGRERGEVDEHGALHRLSAITHVPSLAFLIDHPNTFRYVWSTLGWNVHLYHSHVDVHPPRPIPDTPYWGWHQDGGRQNREIETDPRPRLSVKIAYWLSDVSQPDRGNLMVVRGSQHTNWLPGPKARNIPHPLPEQAMQVVVNPGDALFFDRRIWHVRSDNHSDITRVAAFFGYTYRWVVCRDEVAHLPTEPWWSGLNPVQQQLLGGAGDGTGDDAWGHYPHSNPVYLKLQAEGMLDPTFPPLIPDKAASAG